MLSDREILNLYSVTNACYSIKNLTEYREFVSTKLRQVFPHDIAACCFAEMPHCRLLRLVNIDFPGEYLHNVIRPNQVIQSPITIWLRRQTPLFIRVDEANEWVDPAWLRLARKYNLQNLASHGILDVSGSFFSYFSFARIHSPACEKYEEYLNFLIPHLHAVLVRQLFYPRVQANHAFDCSQNDAPLNVDELKEIYAQYGLSQRERDILPWICGGKTNWEISRIVNISENTVKNHVQNLYKKLGVANRIQVAEKVALRIRDEQRRN